MHACVFDLLASKKILERKLSRKVIHTTSGPFFALTWPLFSASPTACYFAVFDQIHRRFAPP